jgi:hypothetical protein
VSDSEPVSRERAASDAKAAPDGNVLADGQRPGRSVRIDPAWPDVPHPISEVAASLQGALSPFGEVEFPVPAEELPYVHPVTKINK